MSGEMIPAAGNNKAPALSNREIAVVETRAMANSHDDMLYNNNEDDNTRISILSRRPHVLIRAKEKNIQIGKQAFSVDVYALCGMIRRVTQQIGQYNENDQDAYAAFMVAGLRKIRADMVSSLESAFNVHFHIDDNGNSQFYLG